VGDHSGKIGRVRRLLGGGQSGPAVAVKFKGVRELQTFNVADVLVQAKLPVLLEAGETFHVALEQGAE
jgi:hypothetical protein